jgi:hypothetical protein
MINEQLERNPQLEDALVALLESQQQAEYDFCGEQRAWHLPRLNRAARLLLTLFPMHTARALDRCKTPYDEPEMLAAEGEDGDL